jgi:flagellar basal-body rod protein FlgB
MAMLDPIVGEMERYMSLLTARQRVVSSNIANADTPDYKTKDIDFQSELRNFVPGMGPEVVEVKGLTEKNDGNNVNLDREAKLLAENVLRFNITSNLVRSQIRLVRAALDGSK